ncbi:MAG: putative flippase GtrA [Porticoccaceae bacterium]
MEDPSETQIRSGDVDKNSTIMLAQTHHQPADNDTSRTSATGRNNLTKLFSTLLEHARNNYAKLTRFVLFGCVGLSGMLVDLGVLYAVLPLTGLPAGRAIAIAVAMTWNFICNRAVTFQSDAAESSWHQYWRFVASCSVGAAINWSTSLALATYVAVFRENVLLSAVAGVLAGFLLNFQLCSRWVFRDQTPGQH